MNTNQPDMNFFSEANSDHRDSNKGNADLITLNFDTQSYFVSKKYGANPYQV